MDLTTRLQHSQHSAHPHHTRSNIRDKETSCRKKVPRRMRKYRAFVAFFRRSNEKARSNKASTRSGSLQLGIKNEIHLPLGSE